MSVYLHDIPLSQAQARFAAGAGSRRTGQGCLGPKRSRWMSKPSGGCWPKPVWARLSSPHYHASAMDGFALRAADERAGPCPPRRLPWRMDEQAAYVDTGDPLPDWANAVVPD